MDHASPPIRACSGPGLPCLPACTGSGGLLPHRFTLTACAAVYFLWHFPWGCPRWALPTALSDGGRTFLVELAPAATVQRPACLEVYPRRVQNAGQSYDSFAAQKRAAQAERPGPRKFAYFQVLHFFRKAQIALDVRTPQPAHHARELGQVDDFHRLHFGTVLRRRLEFGDVLEGQLPVFARWDH